MALKGLDIFKITPKTNCKDCGNPTCMAFAMKVAQGAVAIDKCPHLSQDVLDSLSEATAPPMKTIKLGAEHTLGGETVLARHEKTFISKSLFAVTLSASADDAVNDAALASLAIDYERIGERMYVELVNVKQNGGDGVKFLDLVKKAKESGRTLILNTTDLDLAKQALEITKGDRPLLNGATVANYKEMNALATEYAALLGVSGADLDELYDTVAAIEALGNKELVLDVGTESAKAAFENAVLIRRAALKANDRVFGYPSLVDVGAIAAGDANLQTALASVFTLKYGSIVVMESMSYAQALPLYGLRQNIFTDPQKPMRVEPGIYPLNGATADSVCAITVDFALTYFVVSGEVERSGIPVNLLITDAGGYSVLTAWAAGKLSASSVAKFINEDVAPKVNCRTLILPGKVAVLKGEIEDKLPDWNVVVGTNEAIELVKFLKTYK